MKNPNRTVMRAVGAAAAVVAATAATATTVEEVKGEKELKRDPGVLPMWFSDLTKTQRKAQATTLRKFAVTARAVAKEHTSNEEFHLLLKFAYEQKIVTPERLGQLAKADRTTATRWINGTNAPNLLAQETVLNRLADEATEMAQSIG